MLFEGVDFGDLDTDAIAETDHAPGTAADEMVARGLKDEEVIVNCGERDEAAHGKAGDIDEEAEIANVGDERRIHFGTAGLKLGFEEREQLDVFAVALGVGRVAFGERDVLGGLLKRGRRAGMLVEERTVDDEIGVTTDRRREMGVFGFGEPVMAERFYGVTGAHE